MKKVAKMHYLHPVSDAKSFATDVRDFHTYEDDLPPAVVASPAGIRDTGSYFTEVKQETTDER